MEYQSNSEQETVILAKELLARLKPGEILALTGELGAGKTVFTRGLAEGLGLRQNITSPTFNIMRLYQLNDDANPIKRVCHIDAYRVATEFDIINIGAEDYIGQADTLTIIEWADKIKDILPRRTRFITFEITGDTGRKITVQDPVEVKK